MSDFLEHEGKVCVGDIWVYRWYSSSDKQIFEEFILILENRDLYVYAYNWGSNTPGDDEARGYFSTYSYALLICDDEDVDSEYFFLPRS